MQSVKKNDWYMPTVRKAGTSKDQIYDLKDGCEAGNDVWTGDSSDDNET